MFGAIGVCVWGPLFTQCAFLTPVFVAATALATAFSYAGPYDAYTHYAKHDGITTVCHDVCDTYGISWGPGFSSATAPGGVTKDCGGGTDSPTVSPTAAPTSAPTVMPSCSVHGLALSSLEPQCCDMLNEIVQTSIDEAAAAADSAYSYSTSYSYSTDSSDRRRTSWAGLISSIAEDVAKAEAEEETAIALALATAANNTYTWEDSALISFCESSCATDSAAILLAHADLATVVDVPTLASNLDSACYELDDQPDLCVTLKLTDTYGDGWCDWWSGCPYLNIAGQNQPGWEDKVGEFTMAASGYEKTYDLCLENRGCYHFSIEVAGNYANEVGWQLLTTAGDVFYSQSGSGTWAVCIDDFDLPTAAPTMAPTSAPTTAAPTSAPTPAGYTYAPTVADTTAPTAGGLTLTLTMHDTKGNGWSGTELVISPSPAPEPQNCECTDAVEGWADQYGDSCAIYGTYGYCTYYGNLVGTGTNGDQGDAASSCCACGGGDNVCDQQPDVTHYVLDDFTAAGTDCSSSSIICGASTATFSLVNSGCYLATYKGDSGTGIDETSFNIELADGTNVVNGAWTASTVEFCLPFDTSLAPADITASPTPAATELVGCEVTDCDGKCLNWQEDGCYGYPSCMNIVGDGVCEDHNVGNQYVLFNFNCADFEYDGGECEGETSFYSSCTVGGVDLGPLSKHCCDSITAEAAVLAGGGSISDAHLCACGAVVWEKLEELSVSLAAFEALCPMEVGCVDLVADWADNGWGDGCDSYTNNNWCVSFGSEMGTGGWTAAEACCGCGGGVANDGSTIAPTVTPTTEEEEDHTIDNGDCEGMVDCDGTCWGQTDCYGVSSSSCALMLDEIHGNGACDSGADTSSSPNLNCQAFEFDKGDCLPTTLTNCKNDKFTDYDCQQLGYDDCKIMKAKKVGNSVCNTNYLCIEHDFDGGDCGTVQCEFQNIPFGEITHACCHGIETGAMQIFNNEFDAFTYAEAGYCDEGCGPPSVVALNLVDLLTGANYKDAFVGHCSDLGFNVRGGLSNLVGLGGGGDDMSYSYDVDAVATWDFDAQEGFENSTALAGQMMSAEVTVLEIIVDLEIHIDVHKAIAIVEEPLEHVTVFVNKLASLLDWVVAEESFVDFLTEPPAAERRLEDEEEEELVDCIVLAQMAGTVSQACCDVLLVGAQALLAGGSAADFADEAQCGDPLCYDTTINVLQMGSSISGIDLTTPFVLECKPWAQDGSGGSTPTPSPTMLGETSAPTMGMTTMYAMVALTPRGADNYIEGVGDVSSANLAATIATLIEEAEAVMMVEDFFGGSDSNVTSATLRSFGASEVVLNVMETGQREDTCMLLGAFELGNTDSSCCITLNMLAPKLLTGQVDSTSLYANEHTCSGSCVYTVLKTMSSAEDAPFNVPDLVQPFVDNCYESWSDLNSGDALQAAYPLGTSSPTPAFVDESNYEDCLIADSIKVGFVSTACCDLLNYGAPKIILDVMDIQDFTALNKDMLCTGSCQQAAISALMVDLSTQVLVEPFEAACDSHVQYVEEPTCMIYDDDHPEGQDIGETFAECCDIIQSVVGKYAKGQMNGSPTSLTSKMTCSGTCGDIVQKGLAASEIWYADIIDEPLLAPWKEACRALEGCTVDYGSGVDFVTSEYCCESVNRDAAEALKVGTDTAEFANKETCSDRWGCYKFYTVVLGGGESEFDKENLMAPFVQECFESFPDSLGGDGFTKAGADDCEDAEGWTDEALGKDCNEWKGTSCFVNNGLTEFQSLMLQVKCPIACLICTPPEWYEEIVVPVSYGAAIDWFCDETADLGCESVAEDDACHTWIKNAGYTAKGEMKSLVGDDCKEGLSAVCEKKIITMAGKCTAVAYLEVTFEGSLDMDVEVPETDEEKQILIHILEQAVSSSIGDGAKVTIISINGVVMNSRRLEGSGGVVFEVAVPVSCATADCSDFSADAMATVLAEASEKLIAVTSDDCGDNCFRDQIAAATLVVAQQVAEEQGVSVADILNGDFVNLSEVVVGAAVVAGDAAVSDAVEGNIVDAILVSEELVVNEIEPPTAAPTVAPTVALTEPPTDAPTVALTDQPTEMGTVAGTAPDGGAIIDGDGAGARAGISMFVAALLGVVGLLSVI